MELRASHSTFDTRPARLDGHYPAALAARLAAMPISELTTTRQFAEEHHDWATVDAIDSLTMVRIGSERPL